MSTKSYVRMDDPKWHTLVWCHSADLDGWTSAAIAILQQHRVGNLSNLLWYNYDKLPSLPDINTYSRILTGDIYMPVSLIEEQIKAGKKITITDHHLTTRQMFTDVEELERMSKLFNVYVNVGGADYYFTEDEYNADLCVFLPGEDEHDISGAAMMYRYYMNDLTLPFDDLPDFVKMVSAYDTWTHKGMNDHWWKDGEYLNYAIRAIKCGYDLDKELEGVTSYLTGITYNNYLGPKVQGLLDVGKQFQRVESRKCDTLCANSVFPIEWEGYKLLACNASGNSALFEHTDMSAYDAGITFSRKGQKWVFGVYNSTGKDMTPLAKKFGGGGHPGACGFSLTYLPEVFTKCTEE